MSRTLPRALALTASALALALTTSACSLLSFGPRTSAFSMKVGQCVQLPTGDGDNVTDLETTDCSALHDAEVFHLTQVTEDERPSDSELEDMGGDACLAAFEGYVGIPYEESELDYTMLYPSPGSWEQGDREIICFIISGDGTDTQLSGSMKGSNT